MQLYTRLNRSGRSHAAVKAPIPPLLHPAMARRLAQADCGDLQPFELWTLRESWFKLTGAGDLRTIPFRRADGVLVPPEAGVLCRVYDGIPGCMAAVCSLAERPPERLRFVPPREICT